jgi:flagellar hook protein FlgE
MMRTSVSGMLAQADRLAVVSDNIANISTTGYKKGDAEFATLVTRSGNVEYESGSVRTIQRRAIGGQGPIQPTSSATDLAISGDGFFIVEGPLGEVLLTRAGNFVPNENGELINAAGYKLLGYSIDSGSSSVDTGLSGLVPVKSLSLGLRAVPSLQGELNTNLPSNATNILPANLPSANAATSELTAKTSIVAYGNLGDEVVLDVYYAKTGIGAWEVSVFDHATASATGGFPYSSGPLTTANLTFDAVTGNLTSTSASSLTVPVPGGQSIVVDLSNSTQLAADFSIQRSNVDGNAPVPLSRIEISEDGILTGIYENGARIPQYRIPLATVASPDNLMAVGGNAFVVTSTSGDMQINTAQSGGAGTINSGALEQSTVDLASELTTMIEAQRSYSANSRVFQTGSEIMDVIVNLKR